MFRFLLKGLMRDKSRSLLPIIVVALGVTTTVFLQAYMTGVLTDSIESTANFSTGHVKVMTKAYAENISQSPNEFALNNANELKAELKNYYPQLDWVSRIKFAGLIDAPDSTGNTRSQGNAAGLGIDLLSNTNEIVRMGLTDKLVSGRFPATANEVLISNELFTKMQLALGDEITLLASGMWGDMAMHNFKIVGTLHFGISMLDRGMLIAHIDEVQLALGMENAAGEILGFLNNESYSNKSTTPIAHDFNNKNTSDDQFAPTMLTLSQMDGMDFFVAYAEYMQFIIIFVFILALSIVLWNAGLLGGLRRYGEFGLRLAIGENKTEIYVSLIGEALMVGVVGSVIGVIFGLAAAWAMQTYGLDVGDMMKDSQVIMPTVMRAKITTATYYIGFVPGIISTVLGAMLAGIGIYKRQTAQLFKELEN